MAVQLTIPLTTFSIGSHDVGPTPISSDLTSALLTVNRAVSGGLDSLTPSSQLAVVTDLSLDSGATWQNMGGSVMFGGAITDWHGNALHVSFVQTSIPFVGQAGRQVRATITVSGPTSVAVSGTLAAI